MTPDIKAKAAKGGAAIKEDIYRIESENVTLREIAERLGISFSGASHRMLKLRKASGAITWARLREIGRA